MVLFCFLPYFLKICICFFPYSFFDCSVHCRYLLLFSVHIFQIWYRFLQSFILLLPKPKPMPSMSNSFARVRTEPAEPFIPSLTRFASFLLLCYCLHFYPESYYIIFIWRIHVFPSTLSYLFSSLFLLFYCRDCWFIRKVDRLILPCNHNLCKYKMRFKV